MLIAPFVILQLLIVSVTFCLTKNNFLMLFFHFFSAQITLPRYFVRYSCAVHHRFSGQGCLRLTTSMGRMFAGTSAPPHLPLWPPLQTVSVFFPPLFKKISKSTKFWVLFCFCFFVRRMWERNQASHLRRVAIIFHHSTRWTAQWWLFIQVFWSHTLTLLRVIARRLSLDRR